MKIRPGPGEKWDRSCHRHPCPETDRIDWVLNELMECLIRLTEEEERACASVADRRSRESVRSGRKNLRVSTHGDFFANLVGERGQCGLSRYLGVPYRGTINTFRAADMEGSIEVRTRTQPWHDCKVRPDDRDDLVVVMPVTQGAGSPVVLQGWIPVFEAKTFPLIDPVNRHKTIGADPQPFHAVPIGSLRPMSELMEWLKTRGR